jgi:hypothetical protein
MAFSISTKGKSIRDDLEHAIQTQWATNNGTYHDGRRAALAQAVNACAQALDVDGNNLHATSFTIAATVTNSSVTVSIS